MGGGHLASYNGSGIVEAWDVIVLGDGPAALASGV